MCVCVCVFQLKEYLKDTDDPGKNVLYTGAFNYELASPNTLNIRNCYLKELCNLAGAEDWNIVFRLPSQPSTSF